FEQQDWKKYGIKVPAMKSTMHSIGAVPLAAMAKELEMAGKKDDIAYILTHHANMLAEHRRVMEELEQCPLLHPLTENDGKDSESFLSGNTSGDSLLPDLDDAMFDQLSSELEDAAYELDEEQMLAVLSRMQEYCYHQVPLRDRLEPVKKKVEMSDYMSAADAVSKIREDIAVQK
ncbi:MAG: hypothetical protein K2O65_04845, partial [Lachnospiraceae bacterium]|nr:hypothetical protein [Lachnospiraceae bacterium]